MPKWVDLLSETITWVKQFSNSFPRWGCRFGLHQLHYACHRSGNTGPFVAWSVLPQFQRPLMAILYQLTHCGLVTTYSLVVNTASGNGLRLWLIARRHQPITKTNVDCSSAGSCGIHTMTIPWEIMNISNPDMICLLHFILSLITYMFRENREIVFIIIVQFMMSANIRIRFGLQIVLICLYSTPSHYHHCANLSEGIEFVKCLSDIFCRVCE